MFERANVWLQNFPRCELIDIETTDKKVLNVNDIYCASMSFVDEDEPILATHLKGLRWATLSLQSLDNIHLPVCFSF